MNLVEEMSNFKNILNEDWSFGKGIYDGKSKDASKTPEVKSVSSATKSPIVNSKEKSTSEQKIKYIGSPSKEVHRADFSDRDVPKIKYIGSPSKEVHRADFSDRDVPKTNKKSRTMHNGPFSKKGATKEVKESWDKKTETPESKKEMFKGKTKAELRAELNKCKDRSKTLKKSDKPEPESLKTKIKELEFALRAKNNFGKVNESNSRLTCKGCGEKCDSKFCNKKCRDEYLDRVENADRKDYELTHKKKKVVDEAMDVHSGFEEDEPEVDDYTRGYDAALVDVFNYIRDEGQYQGLLKELMNNFM